MLITAVEDQAWDLQRVSSFSSAEAMSTPTALFGEELISFRFTKVKCAINEMTLQNSECVQSDHMTLLKRCLSMILWLLYLDIILYIVEAGYGKAVPAILYSSCSLMLSDYSSYIYGNSFSLVQERAKRPRPPQPQHKHTHVTPGKRHTQHTLRRI